MSNLTFVVIDVTCDNCGHTYTKDRLGNSNTGFPADLTTSTFTTLQSNGFTIRYRLHTTENLPFCHRCFDTSTLISINDIQATVPKPAPRTERQPLTTYNRRGERPPVKSTRSVLYDD